MIQTMSPTAKSLILDLLSTMRRGTMPVGLLVEAGDLFEIAENNIRVALARLLAAGLVERDERGRYRLGSQAGPVNQQVGSWRRLEERLRPWEPGLWVAVHAPRGRTPERQRKVRERALRFLGFAPLQAGLGHPPRQPGGRPRNSSAGSSRAWGSSRARWSAPSPTSTPPPRPGPAGSGTWPGSAPATASPWPTSRPASSTCRLPTSARPWSSPSCWAGG